MSTFTLKLPSNYIEIDRDEMEYVDGGGTVTLYISADSIRKAISLGVGAAGGILGATAGFYLAGPIGSSLGKKIGGFLGSLIGAAIGSVIAGKVVKRGVTVNFSHYLIIGQHYLSL